MRYYLTDRDNLPVVKRIRNKLVPLPGSASINNHLAKYIVTILALKIYLVNFFIKLIIL